MFCVFHEACEKQLIKLPEFFVDTRTHTGFFDFCRKFAFGERLETLVQKSVSKTIVEMEQKGDATLSIRPVMMLLVFNISCGMAYGKE